jgi:hypothetical protein
MDNVPPPVAKLTAEAAFNSKFAYVLPENYGVRFPCKLNKLPA